MKPKAKLSELIRRAQCGDSVAVNELVNRFQPILKRYSKELDYEDAYSDLVEWVIKAVKNYKPNTSWGRDEIKRYLNSKGEK